MFLELNNYHIELSLSHLNPEALSKGEIFGWVEVLEWWIGWVRCKSFESMNQNGPTESQNMLSMLEEYVQNYLLVFSESPYTEHENS